MAQVKGLNPNRRSSVKYHHAFSEYSFKKKLEVKLCNQETNAWEKNLMEHS